MPSVGDYYDDDVVIASYCNSVECSEGSILIESANAVICDNLPCEESQCCAEFCSYYVCPENHVQVEGADIIKCLSPGCTTDLCCDQGELASTSDERRLAFNSTYLPLTLLQDKRNAHFVLSHKSRHHVFQICLATSVSGCWYGLLGSTDQCMSLGIICDGYCGWIHPCKRRRGGLSA